MNNDIMISALRMLEDEMLHGFGSVCGMISVIVYLSRLTLASYWCPHMMQCQQQPP